MSYAHQDWTPVVFQKKAHDAVTREVKAKISQLEPQHQRELKDNPEGFTNKMFEKEYIQEVIRKRTEKGWNRKQLATQMNVVESVIAQFETGKHIYDAALKSKLNRVLGISRK